MPSLLDSCEKYYGTRDVYELLGIPKTALVKEVKKAYYKLSLQVHPDRVAEAEKEEATEKFKVLSKLHVLLSDSDKRKLFDERGIIDDDDEDNNTNWAEMWKMFFKPISTSDIDKYMREYTGSELERADIKKAYLRGKGCINFMIDSVPFMDVKDEPRIADIIREWIASGEVPEYKAFTEEPASKRNRRHKKYDREEREAKALKKEMNAKAGGGLSLEQQIQKRQTERASGAGGFFDKLLAKYADVDDDDEFTLEEPARKKAKKPVPPKKATKGGRVTKPKNGAQKR